MKTMSRRRFVGTTTGAFLAGAGARDLSAQASKPADSSRGEVFNKLKQLRPQSIQPDGWLLRYAQINSEGWVLKYANDALPEVWGRYVHRTPADLGFTDNDEWVNPPGYGSYFGEALVHYGAFFPNSATGQKADEWTAQLLGSQDPDGYIGAFIPEGRWQYWLEIQDLSMLIDALMFRYNLTGDPAVLRACEGVTDLITQVWFRPSAQVKQDVIFQDHGATIVRSMGKLYMATGKEIYRKCGVEVLERYGRVKDYLNGRNVVKHDHNAVATEHIGLPAVVYEYTGAPQYLKASEEGWKMMQRFLSVDGTPQGNEMIFETGSRVNSEHCGAVEWIITNRELLRVTGDTKYADAVERAMFNGYPAPKKPDGMAVAYMHTPNQLVATEWSEPHNNSGEVDYWASRQHVSTAHEPLCCNSNGPRGIPFYIEQMVMRSDDGLAVAHYGPCTASATLPNGGLVTLKIDTAYPFEDEVRVKVNPERPASFVLQFRIPGWSVGATIEVNGVKVQPDPKPGTFAKVKREWKSGDSVTVQFQNQVRLSWIRRSEFRLRAQCAAVERGPLVFALPVEEDWQPFEQPGHGPGKDIKSWRLFPKEGAVWNYALIIDRDHPEKSLNLRKLSVPDDAPPFGPRPPVGLSVKARRVLNWKMEGDPEHPRTPGFPFNPMKLSEKVEDVSLVPYGSTRLRMTFLPIIER